MQRLVVDTSVVLAVLTREPLRERVVSSTANHALVAPASIRWEIGNALALQLRRGRLLPNQVERVVVDLSQIPIQLIDVDLAAALRITVDEEIYAYDAYTIACAQQMRLPLLTLDRKLASAAQLQGVTLHKIGPS